MSRSINSIICVLCAAFLMPAACTQGSGPEAQVSHTSQREFGAADKAAARVLSISSGSLLATMTDPYARAVLCHRAIVAVGGRFAAAGQANREQLDAIKQAQAFFRKRAETLGGLNGKSSQVIAQDLRRTVDEDGQGGENAKTALACIQGLIGGGGAA